MIRVIPYDFGSDGATNNVRVIKNKQRHSF